MKRNDHYNSLNENQILFGKQIFLYFYSTISNNPPLEKMSSNDQIEDKDNTLIFSWVI